MKKVFLVLVTLALFVAGSTTFTSCSGEEKSTDEQTENADTEEAADTEQTAAIYQCPMKCEGDKTHDAPGKCRHCEMDLEIVTDNGEEDASDEDDGEEMHDESEEHEHVEGEEHSH